MTRGLTRGLVRAVGICVALGLIACAADASFAQPHHPFAIGANEGAVGHQTSIGAWIIAQESRFYLGLKDAIRAAATGHGFWLLAALSFAYGVFHAAGPGHGKAVITAYMVSNEVALRRGLAIALAAALFQGFVATAIVGIAALVFNATAARMTAAAEMIVLASYLAIVVLGLILVWRKGHALAAAWQARPAVAPLRLATAGLGPASPRLSSTGRFFADDGSDHRHGPDCGCGGAHMPDPTLFEDRQFDWKVAAGAVVTAGARPCSGAIVVLVFSLAQGLFAIGVASTFAMALGTAITTGALAALAVFAKDMAMRVVGPEHGGRAVLGRAIEFCAAAGVLVVGLSLLTAAVTLGQTGASG